MRLALTFGLTLLLAGCAAPPPAPEADAGAQAAKPEKPEKPEKVAEKDDAPKGNGTLLYDVVNRGSRRAFDVFHLGEHGGNDQGHS